MEAERVIDEFFAAWSKGDVDAIVNAFTEDAIYHNVPMEPCHGKAAIRAFVSGLIGPMTPSVDFKILNQVVAGRLVMNERIDTMVIQGKTIDLPVCGVFELTPEGKISGWRDYFDIGQFAGN